MTMKAIVYEGPGRMAWGDAPLPTMVDDRDAIVRVDATTICGTDLHILNGDVPEVESGRILGHEAVGTVIEVGSAVRQISVDDRVLVSCISGCGGCETCRGGRYGQCLGGGGWALGHHIDGTQAEYVRVPFAELGLHRVPEQVSDEAALMIADIVPTAYEVGVLNGRVRPGDTVVIIGGGPIGLATMLTAGLFSPADVILIEPSAARRDIASAGGAHSVCHPDDATAVVTRATGGRGADVVVEAVGRPETFELATSLVRAGGHVANVGVHGAPAALHLETLWARNLTITTGLVDAYSTRALLDMVAAGQLDTSWFVTHHFPLHDMLAAWDTFAHADVTGAIKVAVIRPDGRPGPVAAPGSQA